ncbi:MAG: GNAT family N-acetyltransferase [Candidatus Limnocylindria bacterium]
MADRGAGSGPGGDEAAPRIADAPERGRYEAHLDGALAGVLDYVLRRDRIILVHTEVSPGFEGRGVAAAITRFALDDARRLGRRVVVACPYVKRYLARHPGDMDIVVGG